MTPGCAETLIRKAFDSKAERIFFAFQGGEPTLAGLDYFEKFVSFVKKYYNGAKYSFALQTNGTLVNNEWAAFFLENNFLIGLSLDGDRETHDFFRPGFKGEGSYKAALSAARVMSAHEVNYNILTVVTDNVAKHISKIYNHFKSLGFYFLQFIPCFEPLGVGPGGNAGGLKDIRLTPERYGEFLIKLFDLWLFDFEKGNYISIRHIDNYIQLLAGKPPENCAMRGECGAYFVVESDGSLYPCDFYCIDKYRLKSIYDYGPFTIMPLHQEFIDDSKRLDTECKECEYYFICRGGCKRDREPRLTRNKYCEAYKAFFKHSLNDMKIIANTQRKGN